MNICGARTQIGFNPWSKPYLDRLPHEPKSEERFILSVSNSLNNLVSDNDYAECKHCGSIFAVEEP
jgi:hypothetical protein